MLTVTVRKQGGAAVMTIPADVLKMLDLDIGSVLELHIAEKAFTARPAQRSSRRRYTLAELLRGVTPEIMTAIQTDTAWAREGDAVGRELV
ncbi:MAG: AbrB family transcriptional regulator [Candidatus Competibacteraceae bacterium]|nr:AbrB family transcriptional regulator [Candidatus Competibacteraceae bacterium]